MPSHVTQECLNRWRDAALIGASVPLGFESLKKTVELRLADAVLVHLPATKEEAFEIARYCRDNELLLFFAELLARGSTELVRREKGEAAPIDEFLSHQDLNEIFDEAGDWYGGRLAIGEAGGVAYWTEKYLTRKTGYQLPPKVETMEEAHRAYVDYLRPFVAKERVRLGKGPLISVDPSMMFKYLIEAGLDALGYEVHPGDPELAHAAVRGASRAAGAPWGTHIAMLWYGGIRPDRQWLQRWKTSLYYSYMAGANFVWPESGHLRYDRLMGEQWGFDSPEMKRVRRDLRAARQFSRVHQRPAGGPRTGIGVVHGLHEGCPGLWNKRVWGQAHDEKWLEGPAEQGWDLFNQMFRRQPWWNTHVQGDADRSGNPPGGQSDIVPIEAPLEVLRRYRLLVFLGWNTMTEEIYEKLKAYVSQGGKLLMFLPHLSIETDRAKPIRLFRNGDFSDLFGVQVLGRGDTDVRGVKCAVESESGYPFARWGEISDARFIGVMQMAHMERCGARTIYGADPSPFKGSMELIEKFPILTEHRVGLGFAYLAVLYQYPGDERIREFSRDLLRTVVAGEEGNLRAVGPDALRYAIYDDILPESRRGVRVIYLQNSDADVPAKARVEAEGSATPWLDIEPAEMRVAYESSGIVIVPRDRRVDVASWTIEADTRRHEIAFYSVEDQEAEVSNVGSGTLRVAMGDSEKTLEPGASVVMRIPRHVDPAREAFFAGDFAEEADETEPDGILLTDPGIEDEWCRDADSADCFAGRGVLLSLRHWCIPWRSARSRGR